MAAGTYGAASQFNSSHPLSRERSAQQRSSPRRAPGVPIANGERLVVPGTLGTAIKSTRSTAWRPARMVPAGYRQQDRYCGLYIWGLPSRRTSRSAAPLSRLPASGQGPSSYSRPRAGRPATQCERGRRPERSQPRLTLNRRGRQMRRSRCWAHADHPPMASLAGQRMMSAVLTGGNAATLASAFDPGGRGPAGMAWPLRGRDGHACGMMAGLPAALACRRA
jgi:hypothetical protein